MWRSPLILALTLTIILSMAGPQALLAQPTITSYQGHLVVDDVPYTGNADFKFAILCGTSTVWSNDGTTGTGAEPTAVVSLPVDAGVFSVNLGDGVLAMTPLDAAAFACSTPMLRVWVDTGSGLTQLSDQLIASSLFALRSDIASRARGGFTVEEGALLLKDDSGNLTIDLDPQGGDNDEGAGMALKNLIGNTTVQILGDVAGRRLPEIRLFDDFGNETLTLKGSFGEVELGRIRFPDNTVQTTAAVGTGADSDWVEDGDNVYRVLGNVGIGTTTPTSRLHLSDSGSVQMHIEADTNNAGENDQPLLRLSQDGGLVATELGFMEGSNHFQILRIDSSDTLQVKLTDKNGRNMEITGDIVIGGGDKYDNSSEVMVVRGRSAHWSLGTQNETTETQSGFFIGTTSNDESKFHIERGGDVGIGTSNPQAKLHVVGDLLVTGGMSVGPTTRYLSVPSAAFTPELDTMDYKQNGYNVYGTTPGQLVRFYAPVELPHGAVIKELRLVVDDNTNLSGANVTVYLMEWPDTGGSGSIISYKFTSGAPGGYAQLIETENWTVDNQNNHYFLTVDWDTPSSGNVWDLRLRNARITYEVSSLAP